MRKGKELILATKDFVGDNPTKSWFLLLSTMLILALTWAGTLWNVNLVGKVLCSLISGLVLVRLFVIYHDHQHRAILKGSRLADTLMKFFGLLALTPSSVWQHDHESHHHHNSKLHRDTIGSFPVMTLERYARSSAGERFFYLFKRHPLIIALGYVFVFIGGMCILPLLREPREHWDAAASLLIHVTLITLLLVFAGWSALVLSLLVPYLVAGGLGAYLFYAQHNFPDVHLKDHDGWTYEGAALESSSFLKMGPVMNWFTGNIGYHHVHHLNARIPFYRLPEAMKKMPELQSPKVVTLSLVDMVRCFRLKLWDVRIQKLVPLARPDRV